MKTYVIVGAAGEVGCVVAAKLESLGHNIRRVGRSFGIALDDVDGLRKVFHGAQGAYLMIPFDIHAADLHQRERQFGNVLANAVEENEVKRVVLLSGLSAHLKRGTSLGAALMEDRLDALEIPELLYLRAGFFMENFLKGMRFPEQAAAGSFGTPFRGDLPIPLIAAKDVGVAVAQLLASNDFPSERIRELHGGSSHTMAEATAIMGRALGKPQTLYRQIEYEDARSSMIQAGFSSSFADALIDTAQSFNAGERWSLEASKLSHATPTTLEQWAASALGSHQQAKPIC